MKLGLVRHPQNVATEEKKAVHKTTKTSVPNAPIAIPFIEGVGPGAPLREALDGDLSPFMSNFKETGSAIKKWAWSFPWRAA